jgi:hypothetical protein
MFIGFFLLDVRSRTRPLYLLHAIKNHPVRQTLQLKCMLLSAATDAIIKHSGKAYGAASTAVKYPQSLNRLKHNGNNIYHLL